MTDIDVSLIVATWKAGAFLDRSLGSGLASRGVSVEIIAVDDASPDNTFDKLEHIARGDARVRIARLADNSGPSTARNLAISMARGRFVAVLDADDEIAPDRLAMLVAHAESTHADIVLDNMLEVDEEGRPLGGGAFLKSDAFQHARDIDLETWITFNQPLGGGDCLGYLKPLIRRSKLLELGVRYDPALRNSEDYYLLACLLAAGASMRYLPSTGYRYTRSVSSTSHRLKPIHTRALVDAEARFQADHVGRFSLAERVALSKRARGLRNLHQFVSAIDAIQNRKMGALVGLMASDLGASSYTLSMFARIAAGKVLKRRLV